MEAANNEIIEAALELGGAITGEHGVGTEERQFMIKCFTPVEIAAQRAIKTGFDPAGCSLQASCCPISRLRNRT